MWDIGGQESLRQAWSTYYSSTHFLILVVDSTDRERLQVTKGELHQMLEHEVRSNYSLMYHNYDVGFKEGWCVNICQQTRCKRIDGSNRNHSTSQLNINQRSWLAHTTVLCPYW